MSKSKILIQLDTDPTPSTFDSIVAIDAGVDRLLAHGNVTVDNVVGLVHGAMFTRGPDDLKNTALFFGGSKVLETELIVKKAIKCFFGPLRVSVMSDPNGSNTTAAAAILSAEKHLDLADKTITILAGSGPVGRRIAEIIARQIPQTPNSKTKIRVCSRQFTKAADICEGLKSLTKREIFLPFQVANNVEAMAAIENADVVFGAGAAGAELLPAEWRSMKHPPKVAIDLNAVPPAGIAGIEPVDKATVHGETICYGAIGVGGLKMKIHKRCLESLFNTNDQVLRAIEIYETGREFS